MLSGSVISIIAIAVFLLGFILWARKENEELKKTKYKKSKEHKMMDKLNKIR